MKKILTSLLALLFASTAIAQSQRPLFIGVQPGITKEPFYPKAAFDLNVVPLVLEIPATRRITLRLTTLANYHFGEENQFSDLGLQLVAPVFLHKTKDLSEQPHGFYLAPVYGFGRNLQNEHYTSTVAVEPGYLFRTNKRFTLSIGVQFGGSYFAYDDRANEWHNHFGPKINLGWWLREE